jgi:hypothetical protein
MRDLRELRVVRQALHDLQLKLSHPHASGASGKHPGLARPASQGEAPPRKAATKAEAGSH